MFVYHTQTAHSVALLWTTDQLVLEAANCTTHNKHTWRTVMSPAGFEHASPTVKRLRTCALYRTATGIGYTHTHTYARTHTHTHAHTHVRTHSHTHIHTYIHTHTHTHTHFFESLSTGQSTCWRHRTSATPQCHDKQGRQATETLLQLQVRAHALVLCDNLLYKAR